MILSKGCIYICVRIESFPPESYLNCEDPQNSHLECLVFVASVFLV